MEPGPPISAELWARLRRLDPYCYIALSRTAPYRAREWKHLPRVWLVQIHAHRAMAHQFLNIENPSLTDGLAEAVRRAEERGWGG
jgi:hypothetical protein